MPLGGVCYDYAGPESARKNGESSPHVGVDRFGFRYLIAHDGILARELLRIER